MAQKVQKPNRPDRSKPLTVYYYRVSGRATDTKEWIELEGEVFASTPGYVELYLRYLTRDDHKIKKVDETVIIANHQLGTYQSVDPYLNVWFNRENIPTVLRAYQKEQWREPYPLSPKAFNDDLSCDGDTDDSEAYNAYWEKQAPYPKVSAISKPPKDWIAQTDRWLVVQKLPDAEDDFTRRVED